MSLRILVLLGGMITLCLSSLIAQTDIAPHASEADLGKLIGQKARLEGVYHRDAFNAPAIAISGRVYYLLENPPNKRSFKFPSESSFASIEGILYLYDGNLQFNELYSAIGKRYYFFSMDDARIKFGVSLKSKNEPREIVPAPKPAVDPDASRF